MAGESIRDLKRRIRSIQSTRQITRAMEMVAAAKLRRAQARLNATRPYAATMREMLANLAAAAADLDHPLLTPRPATAAGGRSALLIFTADRGLAGSYNTNVIRAVELRLRERAGDVSRLVLVGKKGVDYFKRRRYTVVARHLGLMGGLSLETAETLARAATDLYLSGEVREVDLVYTSFVSVSVHRVTWERLLPIAAPSVEGGTGPRLDYIFEPDPATILAALVPRYLATRILIAMAESQTAEQGARMISMSAATKNAGELIDALVLKRNRARQAAITKELAEIVGGAEALT